jgi:predicted phage replisome organizer
MAEVKWIKIVTDVFDDEKILMIESMPEADGIIVIWFKLLCLAGKQNNSGVFQMGRMPYTDEMFATIFRRHINTVRLAISAFEQFGMIEIVNNTVTIPNWDKHQSLDALEKRKERDRLYQRERRMAQKAIAEKSSDASSDASSDVALQIRRDKKEIRKRLEGDGDKEDMESPTPSKPVRHKYGEYKNVLLSDEEYEKLVTEFPNDYDQRIERLSGYIASTGKTYKNYLATIRNWAKRDGEKKTNNSRGGNPFLDMLKEEYDG